MRITFKGKEMKIKKHPGMELPFCPFCGEELFCLFDKENKILTFISDFILFCKKCKVFWYNDTTFFSLKKIYNLDRWDLDIEKSKKLKRR
jgi:hypothetical protein